MTLSLQQWHNRYQQQARWTINLRRYLFDRAGIRLSNRVLDVGCGTGVLLEEINQISKCSIFGVDIDNNSILMAHDLVPNAITIVGDGANLPYRSGSFDLVYCHFVLLWVNNPLKVLKEMVRITRPGGYVIALAEPDYGGRIDYPISLSQIGIWQSEALLGQRANPNMGRELRSLFSNSELDTIEVGVLGGQWTNDDLSEDFDLEWDVIKSDLQKMIKFSNVADELQSLDQASRETHQRILYVPTFYAIGEVKA
jgi:ubiquinone/menaquinone biosynthesis C-methylase UbiE